MRSIPACFPLGAADELTQSLNKSGENTRVHLFSVAWCDLTVVLVKDWSYFFCFLPTWHTLLGAPLAVFRGMEQHRGAGGGTESPSLRNSVSPDVRGERGESPASSGPPPCKSARLEVNGSPAAPRNRQNGTPQRPLGGGGLAHKHMLLGYRVKYKSYVQLELAWSCWQWRQTLQLLYTRQRRDRCAEGRK